MKKFKNFVFDLDDTLYQDNGVFMQKVYDKTVEFLQAKLSISKKDAEQKIPDLYHRYHHNPESIEEVIHISKKELMDYICNVDISYIEKNEELKILLQKLDACKYIFTDGIDRHVDETLKQIGLEKKLFESVFAAEKAGYISKRNSSSFDKFFKLYNIIPEESIMFEDNLDNIKMAKSFGVATVLISKDKKADEFVDYHYSDINSALKAFVK